MRDKFFFSKSLFVLIKIYMCIPKKREREREKERERDSDQSSSYRKKRKFVVCHIYTHTRKFETNRRSFCLLLIKKKKHFLFVVVVAKF